MAVDFNSAVNAYSQAAKSIKSQAAGIAKEGDGLATNKPSGFSDLVTSSMKEAVEIGHHSEQMAMKQIKGEADLSDVVMAVANAEHTLNTVVAVRDKVLEAYQSIIKMPV